MSLHMRKKMDKNWDLLTWKWDAILLHGVNLTWAKKIHCRSSWLNSGPPEADCFSSAPTDPATATYYQMSTEAKIKITSWGYRVFCYYAGALENGQRAVPCDQSQLHSSHHSIQIWSHWDSWIESVDKAKRERLIVQTDSKRTKDSRHLDVNERLRYLFTSFENTLTVKEWQ